MTPFEKTVKGIESGEIRTPVVNGGRIPYLRYQLACHKRDLKLWALGIKPTASFKITEYKKYYGLVGRDRKALLAQFMLIWRRYNEQFEKLN